MVRASRWSLSSLAALLSSLLLALAFCTFHPALAVDPHRPRLVQGECIGKWRTTHGHGNLEELPSETHGPDGPHWNNSVAICALMKAENSTDVREWLLYYKYAASVMLSYILPRCPAFVCTGIALRSSRASEAQVRNAVVQQNCRHMSLRMVHLEEDVRAHYEHF